jgi:hypothetical protein
MAYQAEVPGFGVAAKDTKVLALRGMRIRRQCYSAKIGWQVKTIIPIKLTRITGLNVGCSMIFFRKLVSADRIEAPRHLFEIAL